LHFLRLLAAHGAPAHANAYRARYALSAAAPEALRASDPAGARALEPAAGRVPDATALFAAFSPIFGADGERDGPLPADPPIPAADQPRVVAAVRAWLRWFRGAGASVPEEGAAWLGERMEHRFAVAGATSRGEVVLEAPEHPGGALDWHAFVVAPGASLGATARPPAPPARTVLPMPVTYRGMPAPRLWEFEDGDVNLRAIGSDSPATRLLAEFALVFGNDWFLVPVEAEVGSLSRITTLTVTDSFGVATRIPHASTVDGPAADWRMFTLSPDPLAPPGPRPADDVLLLAPTLGPVLSGEPLEDVLLVRDEMANLAWAVERVVTGRAGTRLDRLEAYRERLRAAEGAEPPPPPSGQARYRLGTEVPDPWIPLTLEGAGPQARLRPGALPGGADGAARGIRGSLLAAGGDLRLYEEEVPREGARITRGFRYARWSDGTSHLWLARSKAPGRGEGSSGLRFDIVETGG
jgi:hypothetical protein